MLNPQDGLYVLILRKLLVEENSFQLGETPPPRGIGQGLETFWLSQLEFKGHCYWHLVAQPMRLLTSAMHRTVLQDKESSSPRCQYHQR